MLHVPVTVESPSDVLSECMIDLLRREPTYSPGDELIGRVIVRISEPSLHIKSLHVSLKGIGTVSEKNKKDEGSFESYMYLKKEWNIVTTTTTLSSLENSFGFKALLPQGIPTSLQSPRGNIQYTLSSYSQRPFLSDGDTKMVKAVRGVTIVEALELDSLSRALLDSKSDMDSFKFGWFSCTGGMVRLVLTLERCAFVSGEGIALVGRLENSSDRIVEKAWGSLQRIHRYNTESQKTSTEVQVVQEDQIAIHIGPQKIIRIDKRMSIPPLAPTSTIEVPDRFPSKDENGMFHLRRKSTLRKSSVTSLKTDPLNARRLITVSYEYLFKVRCGGNDIIEMEFPVIVGSKPLMETIESQQQKAECGAFPGAVFKHCRTDKPVSLIEDSSRTLCNKAQLQHLNKYPFYPELKTSSKQGKKLCVAANTVAMESRVVQSFKDMSERQEQMNRFNLSVL